MIDKLDIWHHARHDQISNEFTSFLADRRSFSGPSPIRGLWERRDLRKFGLPLIVHHNPMVGFLRTLRIEITGEGRERLPSILGQLEQMLGSDIYKARVMRVDLAVDVPDVPLVWVRDHVWVTHKRRSKTFEMNCQKSSHDPLEGLTYGQRPNLIRVYNKSRQLSLVKQRAIQGTLTRFERQYGGTGIPTNLKSVGSLLQNVSSTKPFANVRFLETNSRPDVSSLDGLSGMDLLANAGFIYLASELGAQELRKRLGPNRTRILAKMTPIPTTHAHPKVDLDRLFQASVSEQLLSSSISLHKQSA